MDKAFKVKTDASNFSICAALTQELGEERVVWWISMKLNSAELD